MTFEELCIKVNDIWLDPYSELRKRIPKEPNDSDEIYGDGYSPCRFFYCPSCDAEFEHGIPNYCPNCGQALRKRSLVDGDE